jgi:hypothetical protein
LHGAQVLIALALALDDEQRSQALDAILALGEHERFQQ